MARLTTAVAVLVALIAIAASAALAHTRFYPTSTSFGYDSAQEDFLGEVNFPTNRGPCTSGRRVRVFRQRPGDDRLIGRDRSGTHPGDSPGFWKIQTDGVRSGRYYAVVLRKDLAPGDAHDHICRAYRTSALPLG